MLLHAVRKAASTSHTHLSAWYSHLLTGSTLKPSDQEDISLQPEGLFRQWDDRYSVRVSMNMVYVTRLFQNLRNLSGLCLLHHLAISQLVFFDMSKIIHLIFSKHFFFFDEERSWSPSEITMIYSTLLPLLNFIFYFVPYYVSASMETDF